MTDIKQVNDAVEVGQKRANLASLAGNVLVASVVAKWLTSGASGPVEQVAATVATASVAAYIGLTVANLHNERNIEKEQEKFVRAHATDEKIQKFEGLKVEDLKARRKRAFVVGASFVAGLVGGAIAQNLGYTQLAHTSVLLGFVGGGVAANLTLRRPIDAAIAAKSNLVTALEARRSKMQPPTDFKEPRRSPSV